MPFAFQTALARASNIRTSIQSALQLAIIKLSGRVVETIPEDMDFEEILRLITGSNQQDFPVVDRTGRLTGIISMTDLRSAMADSALHGLPVAKDISIGRVATVTMDDSLNTALQLMASLDVRELPVVSREHPDRIASLISRKDVVIAYHAEMERLKKPEFTKA